MRITSHGRDLRRPHPREVCRGYDRCSRNCPSNMSWEPPRRTPHCCATRRSPLQCSLAAVSAKMLRVAHGRGSSELAARISPSRGDLSRWSSFLHLYFQKPPGNQRIGSFKLNTRGNYHFF
ncbi:hypothetical protein RHGRI_020066 [Rhododendron griersonianum]|uniref:Uncharacterized protein n=1 Tax=Rhododendron griersonianum TaxID=479676 RepID=A0AAV6JKA7_9ERIC|nr:hypothetical protein RHGRI_020066 [Rhododendron griersonianum]